MPVRTQEHERRPVGWRFLTTISVGLSLAACSAPDEPLLLTASAPGDPIFTEVAREVGLSFEHRNGMDGDYHMAEVSGSGAAFLDYDNDGDLDVYLVQGGSLSRVGGSRPIDGPGASSDRLFRNGLAETGKLSFVDVTAESGIRSQGYGMGVTVADYDGDGWVDLYVTNLGANQMWHNLGDGTFRDTAAELGIDDDRWTIPAAFFDFDRDGRLDLYVGGYLHVDPEKPSICKDLTGARDYCGPENYPPLADRLFRNLGPSGFADVTAESGVGGGSGPALGVVTADLNQDGWPDLYVGNDGRPNNLWINRGDGTFTDEALFAGCSINSRGQSEATMGVAAADYDADGDLDLFMTHLVSETNTLYRNDGAGGFEDLTAAVGLAAPSRLHTAFGTGFLDYDNDGWLDLLTANGAVKRLESLTRTADPFPFHETNQLFRNTDGVRFEDVTDRAGKVFELSEVSRGSAFGDVDNDGDVDVLLSNNNGPARLLLNQIGNRRNWIGFRVLEGDPQRDSLGAEVGLLRRDRPTQWRRVHVDGSYCSANDSRVLFGLGDSTEIEAVRVEWPDATVEEWTDLTPNRYAVLTKGAGQSVRRPQ